MRTMVRILLLSLVILPLSAGEEGSDSPGELATLQHIDSLEPELLNGIGTSHLRISTDSAVAQKYFNQASSLLHCFREFESLRASRKVLRLDPMRPWPTPGRTRIRIFLKFAMQRTI